LNRAWSHPDSSIPPLSPQRDSDSLAVAKAAQRKLVHILHQRLGAEGVYVFEITVNAAVKGTEFADDTATLTADAVAARFAEVLATRDPKVWWSAIGA
jgi:hypothetical protein